MIKRDLHRVFITVLLFINFTFVTEVSASASNYYVDFDAGSDGNAGTSTGTAWKHSPGDPNATGSANIIVQPGDTVNFKAGVRYKGSINVNGAGTPAGRVTFNGQPAGWGTGKAIIDGTIGLSWTVCPDAATCGGNPNYANIYYATLPTGSNWQIPVFDSDGWLYHQINVALADPFIYTMTDSWIGVTTGVTETSTSDAVHLTNPSDSYYVGAYLQTQLSGNSYGAARITGYTPATNTVTYASIGTPMADSQWDNKFHYSIVNNWRAIDKPGYYAVDEINARIFAWPRTTASNLSVGSLQYGFDTNGNSHVTIEGFKIQGQYSRAYATGIAIRGSNSTPTSGVIIQSCDIKNQVSNAGASANVYLLGSGSGYNYYQNNTMDYAYGRGTAALGKNNVVQHNSFSRTIGTVILYFSATGYPAANGIIDNNTISKCGGLHANGITIYGSPGNLADNNVVRNNRVYGFGSHAGPFAVAQQMGYNGTFYNNIFDGQVIDDGPNLGCTYMRYYNNVMIDVMGTKKGFRVATPQNCGEFSVRGNIIDGFLGPQGQWGSIDHKYNLYLSRAWTQGASYGWVDGVGEADTTFTSAFTNSAFNDFTPKTGAPSLGAFPATLTPMNLFTTDIIGVNRPLVGSWTIGPYQGPGGPVKEPGAPGTPSVAPAPKN